MGNMRIDESAHAMSFAQPQHVPEERKLQGEEEAVGQDEEWEPLYEENYEAPERKQARVM